MNTKDIFLQRYQNKDLAHDIFCVPQTCHYQTFFTIHIRVTEKGLENWKEVGDLVFSYLNKLCKLTSEEKKVIWDEVAKIQANHWICKEDLTPYQNCIEYSKKMSLYPTADWLRAHSFIEVDDKCIESSLSKMTPEQCCVQLIGRSMEKGMFFRVSFN